MKKVAPVSLLQEAIECLEKANDGEQDPREGHINFTYSTKARLQFIGRALDIASEPDEKFTGQLNSTVYWFLSSSSQLDLLKILKPHLGKSFVEDAILAYISNEKANYFLNQSFESMINWLDQADYPHQFWLRLRSFMDSRLVETSVKETWLKKMREKKPDVKFKDLPADQEPFHQFVYKQLQTTTDPLRARQYHFKLRGSSYIEKLFLEERYLSKHTWMKEINDLSWKLKELEVLPRFKKLWELFYVNQGRRPFSLSDSPDKLAQIFFEELSLVSSDLERLSQLAPHIKGHSFIEEKMFQDLWERKKAEDPNGFGDIKLE